MKTTVLMLAACLVAGSSLAQTATPVRPMSPAVPIVRPATAATDVASLPKDYQALYQKEAQKARELRAEVASLTARIAEITRPGGSLVQAYCESPTLSRNTAGARNDCASSGYGCEPVSGLCRTSARSSDECATGFTYCAQHSSCVASAAACQ